MQRGEKKTMYETPIHIFVKDYIDDIVDVIERNKDNMIITAIQKIGIDINKEELIKAMQYDRQQYDKGYADAKAEIEVVRCKNCKHAHLTDDGYCKYCDEWIGDDGYPMELYVDDKFYCGYAWRKEDEI